MATLVQRQIDTASWRKFSFGLAALIGYSYWAFAMPGPWSRAKAAAGTLPEMTQGFPAGLPGTALGKMQSAMSDYLLFQLADIPFAFLNAFVIAAGMALALNRLKLGATPLRFLLLLPMMLFAAELTENALLALMASGALPAARAIALLQQAATNLKFATIMLGTPIALIGVAAAGIAALVNSARGSAS